MGDTWFLYMPTGSEVHAFCPRHPDAGMRRFGYLARCYECGDPVDLCRERFGSKECAREAGHEGACCSRSGSSWPKGGGRG